MRKEILFTALFIAALFMAACSCHHEAAALLARADSLMATRPDSAYNLLIAVDSAHHHWRRADRMRYELMLAEAMNKAYKDACFIHIPVLIPVVLTNSD